MVPLASPMYFDQFNSSDKKYLEKLSLFSKLLNENSDELYKIGNWNLNDNSRTVYSVENISEEIICTSYFTSKPDPQRQTVTNSDDFKYIKPWYESVKKLQLNGIIFYDNLSKSFIKKYQTANIKFVKCKLGNLSLNDERFIIYKMFLLENPVNFVFFTDVNDVYITKNPFMILKSIKKNSNKIFVGRGMENKIHQSTWNVEGALRLSRHLKIKLPNNYFEMAIYNAGIIGGNYLTIMYFLRQICAVLITINKSDNNNMAAMHYVLYNYFYPNCRRNLNGLIYNLITKERKKNLLNYMSKYGLKSFLNEDINFNKDRNAISKNIFSGYPLNSKFKQFELDSNAFFIHK